MVLPPSRVGGDHTVESGDPIRQVEERPMKRWALSVPVDGFTLAEHGELAREAERLGFSDAWSLEVDGVDCFAPLAVVALTTRLRVGTAIANVYTRGPATLALSAAGIADIAPGRFCLGIGSGSQPVVEAWNGGAFARPATRVRETAQFLRRALAGERVVFRGATFAVDGFRLTKPPVAPVPIHIAALRSGMLRVAGEVGRVGAWRPQGRGRGRARKGHRRPDHPRLDGRDPRACPPLSRRRHRHRIPLVLDRRAGPRPQAPARARRDPRARAGHPVI